VGDANTRSRKIWRVRKNEREIRGLRRDIRRGTGSGDDLVGLELRVEHNDEVYLTERRRSKADVEQRSAALLKDLKAHGLTVIAETSS